MIVNGILIDGTTCSGEVTIPDGVTNIGNYAFQNCTSLTSVTIPKSVTSIGNYAFYGCEKLTVYLEEGSKLTSGNLGVDASKIRTYWNEDNLTWTLDADGTMTISGSGAMKDIPAYNNSNVKKVVTQNGVTSIENYAFSNCSSLTDITIPEGVTSIGDYAFYNLSLIHI